MEIPSGLNPTPRPLTPKSAPVDKLFGPPQPEGSFPDTVKDVYFSPTKGSRKLSEVFLHNKERYAETLKKAVKEGQLSEQEAEKKQKAFEKGHIGPYLPGQKPRSELPKVIAELRELEDEQFCLTRLPQQCGDGLYRTQDYYTGPGTLTLSAVSKGWETSKDQDGSDLPVADVVVIGAGPGGLTTAWQTARRGGRVVCFEAELAGSAFSDAGAKTVHHMRTSADGTNMVRDGHAFATLEHPLSLPGHLSTYRQLAREGREGQERMTGEKVHGIPQESLHPEGRNAPATRGELYEHLAQLTHSLATDFKDAYLCERSPVQDVTFEDGLFTVSTSRGHKVKAKNIVLATGLTGADGEKARMLDVFENFAGAHPDKTLLLNDNQDVMERSEDLLKVQNGERPSTVMVQDRLLGNQGVRQTVAGLEKGSTAAVVGSGESAVKAALELLELNPDLSVDLFCKNRLETSQPQLPNENFHQAVLENGTGPEFSEAAYKKLDVFGTPVTPRSLQRLFEEQKAGRLRLLEMGERFDQNSVELESQDDGSSRLRLKSQQSKETLATRSREYQEKGLMPERSSGVDGTNYQFMVQAIGYKKAHSHMLSHLSPEAQNKIYLNTAGLPIHPSQTSIPGLSTRGRQLADRLAREIPPERRIEVTVPQDGRVDWRDTDPETVKGIIDSRGNHPGFVRAVRRGIAEDGSHPQELQLLFPTSDRKLLELAQRDPKTLSAAEREVLARGLSLSQRMDDLSNPA